MTEVSPTMPSGAAPVVWGDVPPRNKNFTGREAILARLRRGASTSKVTVVLPTGDADPDPLPRALRGWGGVGKTAVAIEYAYRYRSEYDIVWWIPAEQLPYVRASLAELAGRLGLSEAVTAGIEGAAAATLDALRRGHPYSRWLLIFDNADRPEDFRDYIPGGPGDVLITSRNPEWQANTDTVQVDVFSRDESKAFLTKRAPIRHQAPDTDLLAEKLGDLPLALDQAGAMLAETGIPISEYVELLDNQIVRILAEGRSAEYPMSVTAAWTISVDKVRQQLPEAQELLRCCAYFGPDPIPRDVFHSGTRAVGTSVTDLMADPILLARAIRVLGRFALVNMGDGAITVHRLIQALLRGGLDTEQQAQYQHDVHMILAAAAPEDPADDRQWPRYRELLPHVTSSSTDLAGCVDPKVRDFVLNMMRYLYLSGDRTSADELTKTFIDRWTADSGPDDPSVLAAQRHLGDMLRSLGRYSEAYELIDERLSLARQSLGERDTTTLALRRSFGGDLRARGDFAAALALDEDTRTLHEEVLGLEHPQTLSTINNLAVDHGLNSNYTQARKLGDLAYRLTRGVASGISATELLVSWYNLAWAVRLEGLYSEARDVGEEAVDYGRQRLSSDHFATIRSATGLSISLRRLPNGRQEAMERGLEVLDTCQRRFGEVHPDTMAAAINLSNVQRVNGLIDEALALAERTVALYPDVYGPRHPYNFGCNGNLALLRRLAGDAAEARRLNEVALAGLDQRLTRDHAFSLVVAFNLSSDLAVLGEIANARQLGEDTLARFISLMGKDHPFTLGCAANLALDLRADGAASEADELFADTMKRYENSIGLAHPDSVIAMSGGRLDFDFDPPPI
jgi:tetratricopeptide (TPR) repeat protein